MSCDNEFKADPARPELRRLTGARNENADRDLKGSRKLNGFGFPSSLAFCAALGLSLLSGTVHASATEIDLSKYDITFSDEFSSLSVSAWGEDGSRWIAHTPWNGDFGDARFADPEDGFPFTVHNGNLRIEARKGEDGQWSSGLLASVNPRMEGFSQQYGYFEARMKLPPGEGLWPAFWLIGVDRTQITAEIDVMEYHGHNPSRFSSAWHVWGERSNKPNEGGGTTTDVPENSLSRAYHTYGVDISPDKVTYYFDRQQIWQVDTPEAFKMPFYPLVNLALGSGFSIDKTPSPSYLWVDYVRAYQRKTD